MPRPRRTPRPRRITSRVAGLVAGVLATVVATVGCGGALPVLGTVPAFSLTERSGSTFGSSDLAGHVWVANFIFTRCPDFCPALTARMAEIQAATSARPVRLVSFSVDPDHDTPDVLADYAKRTGAGAHWMFVTGPRPTMAGLLRDGFHVAYADDGPAASPITHSDRFVLVDQQMRIRGYYHGTDPDDVRRLGRDAASLGGDAT